MQTLDFEHIRSRHDCRDVARRLGLVVKGRGRVVTVKCPAHDDSTPSCSVSQVKWYCHACGAKGDVVDLVRAVLSVGAHEAVEWLGEGAELPPPTRADTADSYPDADDLDAVARCMTPLAGRPAGAYLTGRGVRVDCIDEVRMASALRMSGELPPWAAWWPEAGYQLAFWLYDSQGERRSVLARSIRASRVKSRTPKGYQAKGLALLCPVAWMWIRGARDVRRVIVAEGEIDWLTLRLRATIDDAVIGMRSGTWTHDWDAVMRSAQEWILATDDDATGDGYASVLAERLARRGVRRVSRYAALEVAHGRH